MKKFRARKQTHKPPSAAVEQIKRLNGEIAVLRKQVRHFQNLYGALLFRYNTEIGAHLIALANAQKDLAEHFALGFQQGQRIALDAVQNLHSHKILTSAENSFERGHFAGMEEFHGLAGAIQVQDTPFYPQALPHQEQRQPAPLFDFYEKAAA